ncbi:DUF4089 domain-containing protein [Leptolyngbya ohadii]|uniref:DUF4089 domain-containing protein n=1 Tax=Leptolyngbya ohadii TaxID=1962290 RepID=UPI000B59F2AE|nr:DUF4089 domain-containing protein [Leptolyngbya ohadii]
MPDPTPDSLDLDKLVSLMSQFLDLPIAPEFRPGVIANLERTQQIAQLVMEFSIPDEIEVAPIFTPEP